MPYFKSEWRPNAARSEDECGSTCNCSSSLVGPANVTDDPRFTSQPAFSLTMSNRKGCFGSERGASTSRAVAKHVRITAYNPLEVLK